LQFDSPVNRRSGALELRKVKNKSRFIADAVTARFEAERKNRLNTLLAEGYRQSAAADKSLAADWERTSEDGWK
jgi:hypothetical protein